jgi:hypothetical protein
MMILIASTQMLPNKSVDIAKKIIYCSSINSTKGTQMATLEERMHAELRRAMDQADAYRARVRLETVQAQRKWKSDSAKRMQDEGLIQQLGPRGGFIDDYTAEVPLDIGFQYTAEGNAMIFVSLGGHDVTQYLPPDVLADVNSHLDLLDEA